MLIMIAHSETTNPRPSRNRCLDKNDSSYSGNEISLVNVRHSSQNLKTFLVRVFSGPEFRGKEHGISQYTSQKHAGSERDNASPVVPEYCVVDALKSVPLLEEVPTVARLVAPRTPDTPYCATIVRTIYVTLLE